MRDEQKASYVGIHVLHILFLVQRLTVGSHHRYIVLHANLGYTEPEDDGDGVYFYGGAIEYPLNEKLTLVSEITAEAHSAPVWHALAGVTFALSENSVADFGLSQDLNADDPVTFITMGLTYGF